jgi:outer membrane protein TolC
MFLLPGCVHERSDQHYLGKEHHQYYRDHALEVDYPAVNEPLPPQVSETAPPHTILETEEIPIRDISLAETLHLALQNSDVIRTTNTFQLTANSLYTNPQGIPSVYDPAIQASGVLFGNRGVEAALSAFDAQLNASMIWGRNEVIVNSPFAGVGLGAGSALVNETGAFTGALQKTFANGGTISVNHSVNYLGTNAGAVLYPSSYSGLVGVNYTLPLLAGAGTEFTRIAGPIGQQFGGLTGVSQGVLIARINEDISLASFEIAVQNFVRDVENAYWDLYQAYRNYHTAVTAKESALLTWRIADLQLQGGVRTRAEVAQARDQYFATDASSINSRSNIYTVEVRLRRLIGLPANDGTTLRPLDEPVTAQLVPDWYSSLTQALTRRVELRTQKWTIKSMELQLTAAESLVRPQLNFVSGYNVNGFGNDLIGYNSPTQTNNFYQNLTNGNQTGWTLGLQFNWQVGFRAAMAQVRNYELRLAKAQRVLAEQEREISHELAATFQEVARAYAASETNMNRLIAARENVKFLEPNIREGTILLDELLRAQLRQAQAEVAYYESLVEYNKALNDLQYRKGQILAHNGIFISEGPWLTEAYDDANHNADARNHAVDASWIEETHPPPFASDAPINGIYYTSPEAERAAHPTPAIEEDMLFEPTPETDLHRKAPAATAPPM